MKRITWILSITAAIGLAFAAFPALGEEESPPVSDRRGSDR